MDVPPALAASYQECRRITRRAGSSFYYPLWLLPSDKRRAMYALYAFCRVADDIGDSTEDAATKRVRLEEFRTSVSRALSGATSTGALPALADTVRRYDLPPRYLFEILDGVAMDLTPRVYANWDELRTYCYHVAGAVGLACLSIWGGHVAEAMMAAARCGEAFQLTNIIRDVREDALQGRTYLPQDDLAEFGCCEHELRSSSANERLRKLIAREIARAKSAFDDSSALATWIPPDSRAVFAAMWKTYRALLAKIERRGGDVFSERVRLNRAERLWTVAAAWRGRSPRAERSA